MNIPTSMRTRIRREAQALPEVPTVGDFLEFLASVPVEHQVVAEEVWADWVSYNRELCDAYIENLRTKPCQVMTKKEPGGSPRSQSGHPMLEAKLSIKQASKLLGIGETTLRGLIADGEIPFVRLSGKTLLFEHDLGEFIRRNYSGNPDKKPSASTRPGLPEHIRNSPYLRKGGKAA